MDIQDLLPEDTVALGFDNVGAALNVSPTLIERYLEAIDKVLDAAVARPAASKKVELYGFPGGLALRGGKLVLCAPDFLYLSEQPGPLDDHALAARLSYFLWSTMPDDELLAVAGRGELKKPEVLRAQTERMLADPRSRAFVTNFTGQWLSLREIDRTTPDSRLYPEFDPLLRWSMLEETRRFFTELLGKLKGTAEGDSNLLDRTIVLFGSNMSNASSHDHRNMPIVVAGGGFRHGQHLAFDPNKHPPLCNLYAQFLRRLGADVNGFSTSTAASLPGFEMA